MKREFIGVNMESETIALSGHQMVTGSFYIEESNGVEIIDSLDELPEDIRIFWFK